MTKDQEIDLIAQFVADLPKNSYLADLLQDVPTECAALIRSDLAFPLTIRRGWDERLLLQEENRKLAQEIQGRRADLKTLEKQLQRYRDDLDEIRRTALTLSRIACA